MVAQELFFLFLSEQQLHEDISFNPINKCYGAVKTPISPVRKRSGARTLGRWGKKPKDASPFDYFLWGRYGHEVCHRC